MKNLWEQELVNAGLWFVVFFAAGILIYFSLPIEPPVFIGLLFIFITGILFFFARKELITYYTIGYIFFTCFGFAVASVKTYFIQSPVLSETLFDYPISATVKEVRIFMNAQQLILTDIQIDGIKPTDTPKYMRLNVPDVELIFKSGDKIKTVAYIFPPHEPTTINGYQYARADYFRQIGASARPTEPVYLIERTTSPSVIENIRLFITERVRLLLPEETAGVVIPLIIGEQGTVSRDIYEIYRKTGITHVLSVSGFHLTLLAGFVFFVIRGFLSLFPFIILRINTKKIAAFISILFTFFYLLISGLAVPAIRSFIMIFIVLFGILLNRKTISLRSVALAAFFILLIYPDSLIGASFQLSFMAVLSLITLYFVLMNYVKSHYFDTPGIMRSIGLFIVGLLGVNILANLTTAPYTIYHFNQFSTYGMLGNLLTSGLFSVCIMPLLLIAVLMMPLGWDAPFIRIVGSCLDLIADICRWIAELPYASLTIKAMPDTSLIFISFGFLMMFLMRTRLRWIGLTICAVSLIGYAFVKTPDILVSSGGRVFAVKEPNGQLILSNLDNRFITDTWLRRNGQNPDMYDETHLFTDTSVRIKGHKVAFSSLDCVNAEITFRLSGRVGDCPEPDISRDELWDSKTQAVFIAETGIARHSVLDFIGERPWNEHFMLAEE